MSGQTEFEVVEPEHKHQLFSRLHRAAEAGLTTHFTAVSLDDPREERQLHHFTVTVTGMWFKRPVCDVEDQDGNVFQINFFSYEKARFTVHYP